MTTSSILQKRAKALALLDDFRKWYLDVKTHPDNSFLYMSLAQTIRSADDAELDRLITEMTDRNMRAMTKKMMQ